LYAIIRIYMYQNLIHTIPGISSKTEAWVWKRFNSFIGLSRYIPNQNIF